EKGVKCPISHPTSLEWEVTSCFGLLRFDFPEMNLFGLSDSLPGHQLEECPQCHSAVQVASGLCLRCLLQAGLTEGKDFRRQNLGVLLSGMTKEVNERDLQRTKETQSIKLKYIADNLSKAVWSWGCRLNSGLQRANDLDC